MELIFLSLGITLCVFFSAFFSGMEIAYFTSNKLKIELDKEKGYAPGILASFIKKPARFISTLLLGNNFALVIYGVLMGTLLDDYFIYPYVTENQVLGFFFQTIISTIFILVFAEFLPKSLFRINPNGLLSFFAVPLKVIEVLFFLPVSIVMYISDAILWLFTKEKGTSTAKINFGRIDLDHYLEEFMPNKDQQEDVKHEFQILKNALDFSKVKARDCMVPRTEIVAIDMDEGVETLRKKFIETGLSKIIVYKESVDNIIGYIHSYELFKKPSKIKNVLLPISIVPETKPANDILELFIKQKRMIAVVVDEFGGTSGILTIEDIMEEIFGEIEDEHDSEALVEKEINNRTFLFSGRLEIDYINTKYKLELPDSDEYETLSGLIVNKLEYIPESGHVLDTDDFTFEIVEVSETTVDTVQLRIKEDRNF